MPDKPGRLNRGCCGVYFRRDLPPQNVPTITIIAILLTGRRILSVLVYSLILSGAVSSHPLSVSYSQFDLEDQQVQAVFRLPMDDMDLLLQLDTDLDGEVTQAELERAKPDIESYLRQRVELRADGSRLSPALQAVGIWLNNNSFPYLEAGVLYRAEETVEQLAVQVGVLTDLYPDHVNLARFEVGDSTEEFVYQGGNTWSGGTPDAAAGRTALRFTLLGLQHIVTGYDHLLFLLGLLLVGHGIRNLIGVVTSFTVAHSITLALATLGVVQVPGWIVESAIALSIAYVGLENLLARQIRHRWRLTFLFGLVHGLGFAGILQDMDLERSGLVISLFTFNLGVEIGQVAIVGLCWPLLSQLSKSPYRAAMVRGLSLVIAVFGLLWFVQRVNL